jgi:phenylalanyl-tRNA synthetase beta chain
MRDVGHPADVEPAGDENFIPGRVAAVTVRGKEVGRFGEVHPRILGAYGLIQPVMAFELDVEPLRAS